MALNKDAPRKASGLPAELDARIRAALPIGQKPTAAPMSPIPAPMSPIPPAARAPMSAVPDSFKSRAATIPTTRVSPQDRGEGTIPPKQAPGSSLTGSDAYAAEARKNMRAVLDDYDKQAADIRRRYELTETPAERRMLASQLDALGTQLNTALTNIDQTFSTAREYTAWAGGQANQYLTGAANTSAKALRGTAKGTGGAYGAAIKGMGGQVAASGANTGGALGAFGAQLAAMAAQAGAGYSAQAQMSHDEQAALAQARYAEMVANRIADERSARNAELAALGRDRLAYRTGALSDIADRNDAWRMNERNAVLNGLPGATAAEVEQGLSDAEMSARVGRVMANTASVFAPEPVTTITDEATGETTVLPTMSYQMNLAAAAAQSDTEAEFKAAVAQLLQNDPNFAYLLSKQPIDFGAYYAASKGQ